jgi:hypothetical protein
MAHAPCFARTAAQVAALGVAALVLSACGGQARGTIRTLPATSTQTTGSAQPSTEPSTKAPAATTTTAADTESEQAAPPSKPWAGTTQFMQIERARDANGTMFLNVRRAEKEILGESFETVTIEGPWTEVAMAVDAVNVPLKRVGVKAKELVVALQQRSFSQLKEGFDITFNEKGEISKVKWLYVL